MSTRRPSGSPHGATRPGYAASPQPALPAPPDLPPPPRQPTLRLPHAPPIPGRSRPPAPSAESRRPPAPRQEGAIEVEFGEDAGIESFEKGHGVLFEIWTRNRVYHIDANLVCIAVVTRGSGRNEPSHPLIGARLTGGERRNKSAHLIDIYFPIPCAGTEAVFRSDTKKHGQFAKTSTIERVVLRVRRVRVHTVAEGQAWDELMRRSKR